jgi:phage shock protein PspC (stress-responsive transcriptional regulator)
LPINARFCASCGVAVPASQPIPGRRLLRPREGRQIGGVCIALAKANGWDMAVVRILTIIGTICSSGLLGIAYLAAWIGIPEEPPAAPTTCPPGV